MLHGTEPFIAAEVEYRRQAIRDLYPRTTRQRAGARQLRQPAGSRLRHLRRLVFGNG